MTTKPFARIDRRRLMLGTAAAALFASAPLALAPEARAQDPV